MCTEFWINHSNLEAISDSVSLALKAKQQLPTHEHDNMQTKRII